MYRPTLNRTDRGGAIAAVVVIHAGLLFAFLHMGGRIDLSADPQRRLEMVDIAELQPPPEEPPVVEEQPQPQRERMREDEGAASPENVRSQATPVVAPRPRIELPVTSPVAATETPREGTDPTQGAADVRGPGTGAGGVGTGTGAGGAGTGTGGGGTGGVAVRPYRLAGDITRRDYPRGVRPTAPAERVGVTFFVDTDGYVRECRVVQSSGNPQLDLHTCELIKRRFRYRPALDRLGRPIRHQNFYFQDWLQRGAPPPPLPPGTIVTEPTQKG